MIKLDYDIKDSIAELRFSADINEAWLYRFEIDAALSSLYCIWKFILGEDAPVTSLAFRYPKPENAEVYQHFFDRDIHFDQNSNHMCFPLAAFQQNSMATDPTLIKITEQQCEQLLGSLLDEQGACRENSPALDTTQTGKNEPEDLPEIIRTMLLKTPENFLSQQSVAEQLHMTPRTLARKLKKADSSYQIILDAVRKDLALQYLQATPWSIDEIADMLNYSDPSNFGRAFRRWMGISPNQYREKQY
jgi:AraC-like DNA-binding protein